MLIRSQGKMGIVNLDCVESFGIVDVYTIRAYAGNTAYELGEYSTEEKAIKVLDMICDTCRNIAFIDEQAVVFNMPQDSEV